mmetsp:Transcript_64759/g.204473  ORF Transcript_64759/g.204473 Transcript_64759/m.204473 type:complete len:227 (+) Transcript_64759:481-1161(+)
MQRRAPPHVPLHLPLHPRVPEHLGGCEPPRRVRDKKSLYQALARLRGPLKARLLERHPPPRLHLVEGHVVLPSQQRVQGHPHAPHVARCAVPQPPQRACAALQDLGRHEPDRAASLEARGISIHPQFLGQSEVRELAGGEVRWVIHEDVVGLHVAVHQALGVHEAQRGHQLLEHGAGLCLGELLDVVQQLLDVPPGHELQHEHHLVHGKEHVNHLHHTRVAELHAH